MTVPVEMPAETAVPPATPRLPNVAWTGVVGHYRDVVSPCTEAPEVFHLASFIAAVGCLIGRRAWVYSPHPVYPTFYCLLIGRTSSARKTTAYQFALNLLSDASSLIDDMKVRQLHGLASVEGLASAMVDPGSQEPYTVLCVEDEFRSLLTKGGQNAVANLIPKITELFNCPRAFEVNTKTQPIVVQNPFLCMLAASTKAWFEASMTPRDVSGGFLNRWLLFEGEGERLLPSPPPVPQGPWEDLFLNVAIAISEGGGAYTFEEQAEGFYADFYKEARNEFDSEATSRTHLHALKLGLLYAVLANRHDRVIHFEDIASGIEIAKYCARIADPLAASLDLSPQRNLEEKIISRIRVTPGIQWRDLHRALHVSAGQLGSVLEPLVKNGVVVVKEGGNYLA